MAANALRISQSVLPTQDWVTASSEQPKYELAKPQSHLITRAAKSIARAGYATIDGISHPLFTSDGVDKTLKLITGVCVAMLAAGRSGDFWNPMNDRAAFVDRVFSAVAFFGRVNAVVEVDRKGDGFTDRLKKDYLKTSATFFQAVSKSFEITRFMQGVGLISTEWFIRVDAVYLGGIAARIGNASVIGKMAFNVGLGGCKNFFLFIACAYGIVNNSITLLNWNTNFHTLTMAALSIGADIGKMALILMVFSVSYTWAAVAIATAVCSLTKIVMQNYPPPSNPNADWAPIAYPDWMKV